MWNESRIPTWLHHFKSFPIIIWIHLSVSCSEEDLMLHLLHELPGSLRNFDRSIIRWTYLRTDSRKTREGEGETLWIVLLLAGIFVQSGNFILYSLEHLSRRSHLPESSNQLAPPKLISSRRDAVLPAAKFPNDLFEQQNLQYINKKFPARLLSCRRDVLEMFQMKAAVLNVLNARTHQLPWLLNVQTIKLYFFFAGVGVGQWRPFPPRL